MDRPARNGIVLKLAPAFGQQQFGPFTGREVRVGSDREQCHVVLAAEMGVAAVHVTISLGRGQDLLLAPTSQAAGVYWHPQGRRTAVQIHGPQAIRPGDAIALVSPSGPMFFVAIAPLNTDSPPPTEPLPPSSWWAELKRQLWTAVLTTGPGQRLQKMYTLAVSGTIFRPRNIIAMLMLLVVGGGMAGLGLNNWTLRQALDDSQYMLEECEYGCAAPACLDLSMSTLESLASATLGSRLSLGEDRNLRRLVQSRARELDPSDYDWLLNSNSSQAQQLLRWSQVLRTADTLDPDTAKLLLWAAVRPDTGRGEFSILTDSTGERACGRGMLALTQRQGLHLGLDVQPDAYYRGDDGALTTDGELAALVASALPAGAPSLLEGDRYEAERLSLGQQCVFRAGKDSRLSPSRLSRQVSARLGADASGLPKTSAPEGAIARMALLYAADIPLSDYTQRGSPALDFSRDPVRVVLQSAGSDGAWVQEQVAVAVAKALVLRCTVALYGSEAWVEDLLLEPPPDETACIILSYRLEKGW